jgi:cytidylate kinase
VAERTERRLAEERVINPGAEFEQTLADITDRDHRDTTREDSPLVAAADAIIINSTGLSIAEVLHEMMFKVRERNAV